MVSYNDLYSTMQGFMDKFQLVMVCFTLGSTLQGVPTPETWLLYKHIATHLTYRHIHSAIL